MLVPGLESFPRKTSFVLIVAILCLHLLLLVRLVVVAFFVSACTVLLFLLFVLLLLPLFGSSVEKPTLAAFDVPKCQ